MPNYLIKASNIYVLGMSMLLTSFTPVDIKTQQPKKNIYSVVILKINSKGQCLYKTYITL